MTSFDRVQLNETFASASSSNAPRDKRPTHNPFTGTSASHSRGQANASTSAGSSSSSAPQHITAVERSLLSYLSTLANPILSSPDFKTTLQEVKSALYDKDYARAFGSDHYRIVYTVRWVPSRAIIYRRIYRKSPQIKERLMERRQGEEKVLAIMLGGGAGSEVIALASLLERVSEWSNKVEILAIDTSDWSNVIEQQRETLYSSYPETLSPERLSIKFHQADVLASFPTPEIPYDKARLITILFTISELLLQARSTTLALLAHLTSVCQPGTLLLIVESASLASIPIGASGRTYPLGTLLDHALAPQETRQEGKGGWDIVRSEDSTWYRMPVGANECYPLALENSRVVLRLYEKV